MVKRALLFAAITAATLSAGTASATFSGPNGRISFSAFSEETETVEIFTANPDGTGIDRVTQTNGEGRVSFLSDWSPDGDLIAFDSNRVDMDGRDNVIQVYVMNPDGSGVRQITRGEGFHGSPGFSPDGQNLAIEADWGDEANKGIWIVPADDPNGVTIGEADRVTQPGKRTRYDSEPQFSPNGERIVFTRFRNSASSAIYTVNPDGSGLRKLTPFLLNASDPDWSPDGNKITFDSGDSGQPGGTGDIWVMNGNGTHRKRLTNTPGTSDHGDLNIAQNPVFSPSGTKIMFTRFLPEDSKIKVMNADGSHIQTVIGRAEFPNKVDWGVNAP